MEAMCISGNRDMILQVLQHELNERVIYHPSPEFSCSVGGYSLLRDGRLVSEQDDGKVFGLLASLGLCDYPYETKVPDVRGISHDEGVQEDDAITYDTEALEEEAITYSLEEHNAQLLINLFCIISSRQVILNQALGVQNAFYISPLLMDHILAHPAETVPEFLWAIYGREDEYKGIRVSRSFVELYGFLRCNGDESGIHKQLAAAIMQAAGSLKRVKPYTKNVRNRKYAFRIWLNSIGMAGPEYEEARRIMLGRLYGRSDRRRLKK